MSKSVRPYPWFQGHFVSCLLLSVALWVVGPTSLLAQKEEEEGPPPEEDITLTTKDNVVLRCTWWEPEEPGKDVVPIMLLHGYEGKRQDYDRLAKHLQAQNHAVLSIDLRGHGGSTTIRRPEAEMDDEIKAEDLKRDDFAKMALFDVEAGKKFLMKKNNQAELNIELLCVVGAGEMGSVVAINWAYKDWSAPRLPHFKQGQDIKAMVLLSPSQSFQGLTIANAMRHPIVKGKISKMIFVGKKETSTFADAKRFETNLARFHAKIPKNAPREKLEADKDLFFVPLPTSLQGAKLTSAGGLGVEAAIGEFIRLRLQNKASDFEWTDRTPPF